MNKYFLLLLTGLLCWSCGDNENLVPNNLFDDQPQQSTSPLQTGQSRQDCFIQSETDFLAKKIEQESPRIARSEAMSDFYSCGGHLSCKVQSLLPLLVAKSEHSRQRRSVRIGQQVDNCRGDSECELSIITQEIRRDFRSQFRNERTLDNYYRECQQDTQCKLEIAGQMIIFELERTNRQAAIKNSLQNCF